MGCMQIGHFFKVGLAHPLQRTICMHGNISTLLLLFKQIQQDSILFLSYLTLIRAAIHSDSILSSLYLLQLYYLKLKSRRGFLLTINYLLSLIRAKVSQVSCYSQFQANVFSVSMQLEISRSLSNRSNCYLSNSMSYVAFVSRMEASYYCYSQAFSYFSLAMNILDIFPSIILCSSALTQWMTLSAEQKPYQNTQLSKSVILTLILSV